MSGDDQTAIAELVGAASYLRENFGVRELSLGHIGRDGFERIVRILDLFAFSNTRISTVNLGDGRTVRIEVREAYTSKFSIHVQADAGPITSPAEQPA